MLTSSGEFVASPSKSTLFVHHYTNNGRVGTVGQLPQSDKVLLAASEHRVAIAAVYFEAGTDSASLLKSTSFGRAFARRGVSLDGTATGLWVDGVNTYAQTISRYNADHFQSITDARGVAVLDQGIDTLDVAYGRRATIVSDTIGVVDADSDVAQRELAIPQQALLSSIPLTGRLMADGTVVLVAVGPYGGMWVSLASSNTFVKVADVTPATSLLAAADGRVAYISGRTKRGEQIVVRRVVKTDDGVSTVVTGSREFVSPETALVRSVDLRGQSVAWATTDCAVRATFPNSPAATLPTGPCMRTEVRVTALASHVSPSAKTIPFELNCVNSTTARCSVTVRVSSASGRSVFGSTALDVTNHHSVERTVRLRHASGYKGPLLLTYAIRDGRRVRVERSALIVRS